jgi:hypothetical protein
VVLALRVLDPPRAGCPALWRGCVLLAAELPAEPVAEPLAGSRCWRTVPEFVVLLPLPVAGVEGRATVPELVPLLRVLDPLRLTWPLEPVLGRAAGLALRLGEDMEGWLLRGVAVPSPLVLPAEPELLIWGDGADIEEEGRLPPLLRELPPPDPPRELLPPLV